uniref:PLAT domain-containing protein n=1 Tax=Globodera pallida TaxID=36090 RepID=A0A183CSA9_GLOPA
MLLLHPRKLLLLPLFALCFAAPPFKFGTSVELEGISTEKKGLSVIYRTFNKTEKDDAFVVLQLTGANINDSEVGRKGSDSTNNGTELGLGRKRSDSTNNVTPNSTSVLMLYL